MQQGSHIPVDANGVHEDERHLSEGERLAVAAWSLAFAVVQVEQPSLRHAAVVGPEVRIDIRENVAGAINTFYNNGGTLPANFNTVFGLNSANLPGALSQLDGEAATGAERSAFQLTTAFLGLMLAILGHKRDAIMEAERAVALEAQDVRNRAYVEHLMARTFDYVDKWLAEPGRFIH